jgi:hypothetical protein
MNKTEQTQYIAIVLDADSCGGEPNVLATYAFPTYKEMAEFKRTLENKYGDYILIDAHACQAEFTLEGALEDMADIMKANGVEDADPVLTPEM